MKNTAVDRDAVIYSAAKDLGVHGMKPAVVKETYNLTAAEFKQAKNLVSVVRKAKMA